MFFRISPLRHTNRCRAVIFHGVRFDSTATQRIKRRWRSGKRCARRPWSLSHIFDLRSSRSMKQIEGTITGAILRCLDCSSYNEKCTLALQSTLTELCLLKFAPKIFVRCLYKLQKRYEIMNEFLRAFRFLCSTRHSWFFHKSTKKKKNRKTFYQIGINANSTMFNKFLQNGTFNENEISAEVQMEGKTSKALKLFTKSTNRPELDA